MLDVIAALSTRVASAVPGLRQAASLFGVRLAGPPLIEGCRTGQSRAAIIFVHGYSGRVGSTFKSFIDLLLDDNKVKTWDMYDVGYPTGLSIDIPGLWAADPDLQLCATALATRLRYVPLAGYSALVVVSHSMGGLIVQRALLDAPEIANKVRHVILFGCPSAGLLKAQMLSALKFQFRDMDSEGAFITSLRRDWSERFASPPFKLTLVQGDMDQFVGAESSLTPFPTTAKEVVHGNHLEIVRPTSTSDMSYQIVVQNIIGDRGAPSAVDTAVLAVEQGHFAQAVATLLPNAADLDNPALVTLALALEETGRRDEAIAVLKKHYNNGSSSTDVLGVLGGRLKREWLVHRRKSDWVESCGLYESGLRGALTAGDFDQAYYHAINIAFMELMAAPDPGPISLRAIEMGQKALEYCEKCAPSFWRHCTEGEALLITGRLHEGASQYAAAIPLMLTSPRNINSAYSQATRVASRVFGHEGLKRIETVFS